MRIRKIQQNKMLTLRPPSNVETTTSRAFREPLKSPASFPIRTMTHDEASDYTGTASEIAMLAFRTSHFALLAACITAAQGIAASFAQIITTPGSPDGVVHLTITTPVTPRIIPDTLFGSFLEPIRSATYGGLWAQVVENPSFEEGLWSVNNVSEMLRERPELHRASDLGLPLPWQPLDASQGNRYLAVRGDAANSAQSLLLMSLPGKQVGVLQRIFVPAERELNYNGSLSLKHVRGNADFEISLRRHDDPNQILTKTTIVATSTDWQRYDFALALPPHVVHPLEPVDLVLAASDDARVLIDNVLLNPADAVNGMDPEVLTMSRELHSPVVRFGGNFTSAYNWRDGIGPADKRVSMVNASWGIPEYNTFGTDEFLRFCKLIGAQPQVALNLGTGDPQQAADWVGYIDDHWNDGKGGLLWELGNELWGDFQIGYPSPERIAAVTLATSHAIHAVDPTARIIGTGGDEDFFEGWNARQLGNPPGTVNYLSTHFVVQDNVVLSHASSSFRSLAALALPIGLAPRMHHIQQQAVQAGQPDIHVAFTEWLMVSDGREGPNFTNLGGALFAGGFLNMAMRNSDVLAISNMTGILEFGGISKRRGRVFGAPAYWVLRQYSQARPHTLLHVQSDGPTYSVTNGIQRLSEIRDVPFLDCAAGATAENTALVLTCVNRSLDAIAQAQIDLSAYPHAANPVRIATLTGANLLVENDESEPLRIVPHNDIATIGNNHRLDYSFPPMSVTILQVPQRN